MLVEAVLGLLCIGLLWLAFFRKPSGLPPGRWGLPVTGYIPLTKKSLDEQLLDLHKQHGDIYLWRLGSQVAVFLHNYQDCKDVMSRAEFVDRPDWDLFKFGREITQGVVFNNGANWHDNRRFSLRQLRDLGMGKSKMVSAVQDEALMLLDSISQQLDTPAPMPHNLRVAINNVIWQMVGGFTFKPDDPFVKEFEVLMEDLDSATTAIAIPDFFRFLKLLPMCIRYRLFRMDALDNVNKRSTTFFQKIIDEHKEQLDRDNPRDLIDSYLIEIEEKKDDPNAVWNVEDMISLILDLFAAGTETTTYTMTWMAYYLACNPEVQTRLQEEIDQVLPEGAMASLEDRSRLPYMEAVIHETLRMSSLVPMGLQHAASQDTTLRGYTIPKGTVVSAVAFSLHRDARLWDQPDAFMPERWLDQDGKLNVRKEGFLPFGVGKRQCLGESLARMELLIFATAIYQKFSVAPPPGKDLDLTHDPISPMFHTPRKQDVVFTRRK